MPDITLQKRLASVAVSLKILEQAAFWPMRADRINVDATLYRFQFSTRIFWNLLQKFMADRGLIVELPKDVLREAYQAELIDHEAIWISMVDDRNMSSHTYSESDADAIYGRIREYVPVLKETLEKLRKKIS